MKCLIVTGLSGAGKSHAIKYIEDLGYFCVDNMLPDIIPSFISMLAEKDISRAAFVVDSRSGNVFDNLIEEFEVLRRSGVSCKVIYLEADDEIIIRRYKESRRKHPLAPNDRIMTGLAMERKLLSKMRDAAEIIIDTSSLKSQQLRNILYDMLNDDKEQAENISVTIISFGYKYGLPTDSDIVFDVRFLPNPFYIESLKEFSGLDKLVSDYVLEHEQTKVFLNKISDLIEFLLPHYKAEGKQQLVIAIGCTGGKHRSVAIVEALYTFLKNSGISINVIHRGYLLDTQNKRQV